MKMLHAVYSLLSLTVVYVAALFVLNHRRFNIAPIKDAAGIVPVLAVFAFASFYIRFARWRWLLARRNYAVPAWRGFAFYLAGFAFTASPGKVGELVRIRYFAQMCVPADRVLSCFIFERLMDLVTLGLLSAPIATTAPGYGAGLLLIAVAFISILVLSRINRILLIFVSWFRKRGWNRIARITRALGCGLAETRHFLRPREMGIALAYGVVAWGLLSAAFLLLLARLSIMTPILDAIAVQPAAMLIGAASMLPGGVGATETSMALLLGRYDVPLEIAALAAILFRIGTLWFSIVVGLTSMSCLEHGSRRLNGIGMPISPPEA
jgi:uncharacterized protein (TIRG00374 family)